MVAILGACFCLCRDVLRYLLRVSLKQFYSVYICNLQDFRYMATSDLLEILKKANWRRDDDQEKRLVDLILQQLDDASGDVSSLAVKWCALRRRSTVNQRLPFHSDRGTEDCILVICIACKVLCLLSLVP